MVVLAPVLSQVRVRLLENIDAGITVRVEKEREKANDTNATTQIDLDIGTETGIENVPLLL